MTDSTLLEKKIRDSGLFKRAIMNQLGIRSYSTLRAKIGNESEFTASEIDKLCDILHIDSGEREAIFFAVVAE